MASDPKISPMSMGIQMTFTSRGPVRTAIQKATANRPTMRGRYFPTNRRVLATQLRLRALANVRNGSKADATTISGAC